MNTLLLSAVSGGTSRLSWLLERGLLWPDFCGVAGAGSSLSLPGETASTTVTHANHSQIWIYFRMF